MSIPKVLIPPNAVRFDKYLGQIQQALADGLPWLTHAFGQAQRLVRLGGDGRTRIHYPGVHYHSNKEYLDMMPNENYGNFSFFYLLDPEEVVDYSQNNYNRLELKFTLIFWLNVNDLEASQTLEKAKSDIQSVITRNLNIQGQSRGTLKLNRIYKEAERIYREFDIREIETQFLMRPWAGLRFEGELTIFESCTE